MSTAWTLTIDERIVADVIAHAQRCAPDEACGLLLGTRGPERVSVQRCVDVPNVASDRKRTFVLDPASMLAAEDDADRFGLSVVGVMHSHPTSAAEPSATDRRDGANYDPDHRFVHLLVSLVDGEPTVAAWRFGPEENRPVRLEITSGW